MRLLDARALIYEGVSRLVDDAEVGHPCYTILSHTWGKEEVLYEDIELGPNHEIENTTGTAVQREARGYRSDSRFETKRENLRCAPVVEQVPEIAGPHVKKGWLKVLNACLQTCRDGYDYIWIVSRAWAPAL